MRRARFPPAPPGGGPGEGAAAPLTGQAAPSGLRRRAIRALRDEGLGAVRSKAAAALGSGASVVVFEMRGERVAERAAPVPGVAVMLLEEGDVASCVSTQPVTEPMLEARLRRGDRCVVALEDGRVLGSRWSTTSSADIGDLWLSFPVCPGVAYSYDAFTLPEARGRGIGAAVTAALFERAVEDGAARVINAVLPDNGAGQGLARGRSDALGTLRCNRFGDRLVARCRIPAGYLGAPVPFKGAVPA